MPIELFSNQLFWPRFKPPSVMIWPVMPLSIAVFISIKKYLASITFTLYQRVLLQGSLVKGAMRSLLFARFSRLDRSDRFTKICAGRINGTAVLAFVGFDSCARCPE